MSFFPLSFLSGLVTTGWSTGWSCSAPCVASALGSGGISASVGFYSVSALAVVWSGGTLGGVLLPGISESGTTGGSCALAFTSG